MGWRLNIFSARYTVTSFEALKPKKILCFYLLGSDVNLLKAVMLKKVNDKSACVFSAALYLTGTLVWSLLHFCCVTATFSNCGKPPGLNKR